MSNAKHASFISVAALLLVAGCAGQSWVPGPDARGTVEEARAKCSIFARHSGGSFAAVGTPRFVAGATVGYAVGDAVRAGQDYDDCMMASGWLP